MDKIKSLILRFSCRHQDFLVFTSASSFFSGCSGLSVVDDCRGCAEMLLWAPSVGTLALSTQNSLQGLMCLVPRELGWVKSAQNVQYQHCWGKEQTRLGQTNLGQSEAPLRHPWRQGSAQDDFSSPFSYKYSLFHCYLGGGGGEKRIKTSFRRKFSARTTPSNVKISCLHCELTDLAWLVPNILLSVQSPMISYCHLNKIQLN